MRQTNWNCRKIVYWNLFQNHKSMKVSCRFNLQCFKSTRKRYTHHRLPHVFYGVVINTLRPTQDGRHFADDIFTRIFYIENCCILNKFSLKYVRKGPTDNNPALVQIMAWRRPGDKPLSEPMMVSLLTHICATRPQWVNYGKIAYTNHHWIHYCRTHYYKIFTSKELR